MSSFKNIRSIALLLGTVVLSGCADWENHMQSVLPPPAPAYADKQIVVAPQRSEHTVVFARNVSVLSASEQAELEQFIANSGAQAGDTVLVEATQPNARRIERQRVANVTTWLRRHGYATESFAVNPPEEGSVRLQASKLVAVAPNCPNWDMHPYYEYGSQPLPNLGCADRTNLAAMVVDPQDLVNGREASKPFGRAALNGEIRYRNGEVTQLQDAEAAVGN